MSQFAQPAAPSAGIRWADLEGRLLLIKPLEVKTGIQTAYGESDAVRADVVVLDGDNPGEEYADTLVFPKLLQGQLSRDIGKMVLGRVTTGTAKPGQSAPWLLSEATADDQSLGERYLASRAPQTTAPAPPQQGGQQQGGSVPF